MTLIKKIDLFILKKFLQLFAGSFFVCLLVFMMQFTWRYIDDLIGKGLTLDILGKFFWYMGLTLVPTALPLAILLASLITFSNMGEKLELLSMKAAGISILRVMRSLILFSTLMMGVSFYFQNVASPHAQIDLRTLLISMRQTSPAVEIPEGVFYSGVPNVNLYVQRKDTETGMLYQVIIYKTDRGFESAQIVLAGSARMEMSADKQHLTLEMWNGEQFENLQGSGNTEALGNVPYDRETFIYKRFIIDFDANFNQMDGDMLRGMASAKNEHEIDESIDSLTLVVDSISESLYRETMMEQLSLILAPSVAKTSPNGTTPKSSLDALISATPVQQLTQARDFQKTSIGRMNSEYEWRADFIEGPTVQINRHKIEWHQKITLSLACLFFFFIGAPLGSAIGKGGLGMSSVVSVAIFILYYLVNTSGMKMGRQGDIDVWIGMWASTVIMAPCAVWLTYRAQHDKLNINITGIWNAIKNLRIWRQLKKR